jgi:hypothetical protein
MGFCRAPGYHGSDMSMFKQIYFDKEHSRYLELRLESLNWTNTPIFSTPGTTFGSGSYGIITGQANSPRTVQLGGKIYF